MTTAYQAAAAKFGTVNFNNSEYALTNDADYTSRLLPAGYTNFVDASEGDDYDFEVAAKAIDADGNEYIVSWIFTGRKGENDPELDSYDYSAPTNVTAV